MMICSRLLLVTTITAFNVYVSSCPYLKSKKEDNFNNINIKGLKYPIFSTLNNTTLIAINYA